MKTLILLWALISHSLVLAQTDSVKIATFDSGFGGFFTAKEIETTSHKLIQQYDASFTITHYGDTSNAPYGEKRPEEIASFTARGISRAFQDGAEKVFIACNTASTQIMAVKKLLDAQHPGRSAHIVSIIESSVQELKKQVDERLKDRSLVRVAILATPFTVKAMTYPRALAEAYGVKEPETNITSHATARWYTKKGTIIDNVTSINTLTLPDGKKIEVHQLGPGNWVDMIEHAAAPDIQREAIKKDMRHLEQRGPFDVVGEFCTHFPVFDQLIKSTALDKGLALKETTYIKQGPLMANIFQQMMQQRLENKVRKIKIAKQTKMELEKSSRPRIYLSGNNIEETIELSQKIFAADPLPEVKQKDF